MEILDETEKVASVDPAQSTTPADSEKTDTDSASKEQDRSEPQAASKSVDDSDTSFNFFSIEALDFRKTPRRNKELHRFRDILKSPFINVPLLIVERQEDILPVLSLYLQDAANKEESASFFSVTPSDFDMDDESDFSFDLEKKINLGGTIIEFGQKRGAVPVYCDLADYMDRDMFGKFVTNFLKKEMPAVLCVRKPEIEDIRQAVQQDRLISGGIENPMTPYEPRGLARSKELEISPLTQEEKHIYFSHYINQIAMDNNLTCSSSVCRYFINQMMTRFSHQDVFFKVFDLMNQAVVMAQKTEQTAISKSIVNKVLKEHAPLHNRTRALMDLDTRLKQKIYGQDQAIDTCYETILSDLDDENRTKPTVLAFFGPSGVGKTALAEEISQALTGKKVSTINMAEYSDSFKVSILTGSSKGYVNSDEDGLLAKIVKENPKAVILLDEFEKAHPEVQQMFLGVFDKGSLFDNHSGQIDMSQTTIILTSNAGIRSNAGIGFGSSPTKEYVADKELIQNEFPPELLGRLDAKVLFNPLSQEALEKIVDKFMLELKPRFDKLGVRVSLSPEAKQELVERAKDPTAGARPILSLIRQKVKTPIEIAVLKRQIKKGAHIIIRNIDKKEMDVVSRHTATRVPLQLQNTLA